MGESRRHPARDRLRRAVALAAVGASLAATGCLSGPIAGSAQSSAAVAPSGTAASVADQLVEGSAALDARPVEGSPTPSPTPSSTPTPSPSPTATRTPTRTAAAPPADPPFAGFFALGAVVQGPGEFRIGTTSWYIQVPADMHLRWDYISEPDAEGVVRWGWSDLDSGSQIVVSARDVTDVARVLTGESAARARANRNFDAIMGSVSRQTAE